MVKVSVIKGLSFVRTLYGRMMKLPFWMVTKAKSKKQHIFIKGEVKFLFA